MTFVLVGKMGKLSLYARQRIVNLHQLKKNHFQIANEIREGDKINVSISVLSIFLSDVLIKRNLHDKLNHALDEIKKLSSEILISSMNRCEETINFFRLNLPLFCWGILKHRSVRRVLYERNRAGPGVGQTIANRSVNCRLLCALGSTCTSHAR